MPRKFDAAVYAGERLSAAVQTVTPALMTSRRVSVVFASELFMARRDIDIVATAKRVKFLSLAAFLADFKIISFSFALKRETISARS